MSKPIKVDCKLGFVRWKELTEKPTLELAADDQEVNISDNLDATVSFSKDKLYEILKASEEQGKTPIFELTIEK